MNAHFKIKKTSQNTLLLYVARLFDHKVSLCERKSSSLYIHKKYIQKHVQNLKIHLEIRPLVLSPTPFVCYNMQFAKVSE